MLSGPRGVQLAAHGCREHRTHGTAGTVSPASLTPRVPCGEAVGIAGRRSTPWTVRHAALRLGESPPRALPSPGLQPQTLPDVAWAAPHGRQGPGEGSAGLVSGRSALPWLQLQLKEASGNGRGAQHRAPDSCVRKRTPCLENRQTRA